MKVVELICATCGTIFCFKSFRILKCNKYNALNLCNLLFFVIQILPMYLQILFGIGKDISRRTEGLLYDALLDTKVDMIYCLFIAITPMLIHYFSLKIPHVEHLKSIDIPIEKLSKNAFLKMILFLGMFITVPFILFAPKIESYLHFANFWGYKDKLSPEYLYHSQIMSKVNMIAFFCILFFYMLNKKQTNNFFIAIAMILMTWINGKRTLILFTFIGIIAIDSFVKKHKFTGIIKKAILFIIIEVCYFLIYREITGKGSSTDFYSLYTLYFSRMGNVKLSIYELFDSRNMLDYPCQTILYDLFWFVPRVLWPTKPYMYVKYHTSYAFNMDPLEMPWNFQVNIWTEMYSNLGLISPLISVIIMYIIAKRIEKSSSMLAYLSGIGFLCLYSVFGFEGTVCKLFTAMILFLISEKFSFKKVE